MIIAYRTYQLIGRMKESAANVPDTTEHLKSLCLDGSELICWHERDLHSTRLVVFNIMADLCIFTLLNLTTD